MASPRRSTRLKSLENVEVSPLKRARGDSADGAESGGGGGDDDARSSEAGAGGVGAAAENDGGAGGGGGGGARSPPRKRRCGQGAWAAEFSVDGTRDFARLRTHFRDDIDAHKLTVKEPDGTLTEA